MRADPYSLDWLCYGALHCVSGRASDWIVRPERLIVELACLLQPLRRDTLNYVLAAFSRRWIMICAVLLGLSASPAAAWDGVHTGKVSAVEVTAAGNFAFRVYFVDTTAKCGTGTNSWGYVEKSFSNYDALVSLFFNARAENTSVTVYMVREGYFCRMDFVRLHSKGN